MLSLGRFVVQVLCITCILFTKINCMSPASGEPEIYELFAAYDDERSITSQRSGQATDTNSCGDVRSVPADVRSELNLPAFFQKYTEAYGIPVLSSSKVSDAALQRACYTARFLLADRFSVRNGYYKRNGRFAVVGRSESATDIPGVTGDKGFGATILVPVSVASESDALCEGSSGDMVLDMFTQGMVSLGANNEISDFQSRLTHIFDGSMSFSGWDNDAASSAEAHFAKGVLKYYKDADTRVEFSYFQPYLYELIQEVFPCNNEYINRCDDKTQEKSLSQRLRINAPECKLEPEKQEATTTTTPVPTTTTTQTPTTATTTPAPTTTTQATTPATTPPTTTLDPNCTDKLKSCHSLAIRGKCYKKSVQQNCQRSCVCNPPCFDLGEDCEKKTKRCHDFVVKKTCAKTCGVCQ